MTDVLADIEAAAEQVAGDALAQTKARADAGRKEDLDAREAALEGLAARMGVSIEEGVEEEQRAREAALAERLDELIQLRAVAKSPTDSIAVEVEAAQLVKGWREWVEARPARSDVEERRAAADAVLIEARRELAKGDRDGWLLHDDRGRAVERLTAALGESTAVDTEHERMTGDRQAAELLKQFGAEFLGGGD